MIRLNVKYQPYSLKLKTPFITSKKIIEDRKGFLITVYDDEFSGRGDAAPFPEFGSENYDETKSILIQLNELNFKSKDLFYSEVLNEFNSLPSLKHGIEQAVLNYFLAKGNLSVQSFLNIKTNKEVEVNAATGFLDHSKIEVKVKKIIKDGFKTIKVKTGRDVIEEDIEAIKLIRKLAGENVKIRIDTNGKWNVAEAEKVLNKIEQFEIEYAEQPVKSLVEFIDLKNKTDIPLAADESIRSVKDAKKFIKEKAASILILKPMMIGGLAETIKIIKLAEENNIQPVITSSFETALGREMAVITAGSVKNKIAHGLSVGEMILNDPTENKFPVLNGKIKIHG